MANTSSVWKSRENVPQAKAQLQQVQGPKQVNAIEGVNMMVNKRRQKAQQVQNHAEQYVQANSGFDQDESYSEQQEEVQYVNNFQGQRNNSQGKNQQQWRSQVNQGNWNNQNNLGNWNNQNNKGNWNGQNNKSNWGGNSQGY
ncbi:uncharacterized protein [Nicotiana tomentosiformis]|uniref:uncharacterized protein n=1 Tax=Nicotiana tomentosiformis TaxID=4098 RepID=UPI00388C9F3D